VRRLLKAEMNYNVVLCLIISCIAGLADSIWNGTIFAGYLYVLSNSSNTKVGVVEAVLGASTLAFALPVGWIADKSPRHRIIAVGGLAYLAAIALTVYAVWPRNTVTADQEYQLLLGSAIVWGFANGVFTGPVQALFADCVPDGKRSKWYNYQFLSYLIPSSVGPATSIVLFKVWGSDQWTQDELRRVLLAGVLLEIPVGFLLMMFRPTADAGQHVDATGGAGEVPEAGAGGTRGTGEVGNNEDVAETALENPVGDIEKQEARSCGCLSRASIPYILFLSDLLVSLASGMTIKFFPLFFKSKEHGVGLSPAEVQGIYVSVPILIAISSTLAQRLSRSFGRVQIMIAARAIGVSFLLLMILLKDYRHSWQVMVPIYLVRTAANNSTYPLEESIQMDWVTKETRARWKSLASLMQFGWCGSAVFGGILTDASSGDYTITFLITAMMQLAGGLCYFPLLPLVPCESELEGRDKGQGQRGGKAGGSGDMQDPLLQALVEAGEADEVVA